MDKNENKAELDEEMQMEINVEYKMKTTIKYHKAGRRHSKIDVVIHELDNGQMAAYGDETGSKSPIMCSGGWKKYVHEIKLHGNRTLHVPPTQNAKLEPIYHEPRKQPLGRWPAEIRLPDAEMKLRKHKCLRTYDTAEEGALAFDVESIKQRGPYTITNFTPPPPRVEVTNDIRLNTISVYDVGSSLSQHNQGHCFRSCKYNFKSNSQSTGKQRRPQLKQNRSGGIKDVVVKNNDIVDAQMQGSLVCNDGVGYFFDGMDITADYGSLPSDAIHLWEKYRNPVDL